MSKDLLRMVIWVCLGLLLYGLAICTPNQFPAVQTVFYKMGHVTTLAWIGYWISRKALGRVVPTTDPTEKLARAVLIGAVIIAGSMGL